jgi:long-chain fatty acid transport protein
MQNHYRSGLWSKRTFAASSALLSAGLLSQVPSEAEGFRNSPAGGFSLARAGGRFAQIDTPAAVQHNPANVVRLESAAVEVTPTIVYIKTEHRNAVGQNAETKEPWKLLPNAFATFPVMENKLAFGLGITTPFGLANEWEETGAFGPGGILRYQTPYFAELVTANFNPTISGRLAENLTVGAGLDIYWSQLKFRQKYPWFVPPFGGSTEGEVRAKGDGVGFGGNAGITWDVTKGHRLAVTYRSPVEVEYDGDFRVSDIPPVASFLGATPESSFATEIDYPTIIGFGYGVEVTDNIRLEVNFEWLEFSNFKSLDLQVGNNAFLFPSTSLRQDWKDTFTAGIGGDWRFAPNWWWLASYQFYESPVPDHTFSTTIPDANQHAFTTGLRFKNEHHGAELGYGYIKYDDRDISSNGVFNGQYETTVHLISASYIYSF